VQANVGTLNRQTSAAKKILATNGDENVQGQLDRIVQMLGVMQGTMTTIAQQTASAGRVTAGMAATAANEQMVEREMVSRARERQLVTKKVRVPDRLP
jgi:hypothetical protein